MAPRGRDRAVAGSARGVAVAYLIQRGAQSGHRRSLRDPTLSRRGLAPHHPEAQPILVRCAHYLLRRIWLGFFEIRVPYWVIGVTCVHIYLVRAPGCAPVTARPDAQM